MKIILANINGEEKEVHIENFEGETYIRCLDIPMWYNNKIHLPMLLLRKEQKLGKP